MSLPQLAHRSTSSVVEALCCRSVTTLNGVQQMKNGSTMRKISLRVLNLVTMFEESTVQTGAEGRGRREAAGRRNPAPSELASPSPRPSGSGCAHLRQVKKRLHDHGFDAGQSTDHPHGRTGDQRVGPAPQTRRRDRIDYGQVSIEGHQGQKEHGAEETQEVEAANYLAHGASEGPVLEELVHGHEGDAADEEQRGQDQVQQQQVGHCGQLLEPGPSHSLAGKKASILHTQIFYKQILSKHF
uniref:Uncharacterized protein n=1 Tax=Knipowitschia caucasica TaxID=637954 RepID=A0AAV2K9L7_KNICA